MRFLRKSLKPLEFAHSSYPAKLRNGHETFIRLRSLDARLGIESCTQKTKLYMVWDRFRWVFNWFGADCFCPIFIKTAGWCKNPSTYRTLSHVDRAWPGLVTQAAFRPPCADDSLVREVLLNLCEVVVLQSPIRPCQNPVVRPTIRYVVL